MASVKSDRSVEGDDDGWPKKFTFFSEVSMFELAFGIGAIGVNSLCVGMVLNIPTATLHRLMYDVVPKGLLHTATTDQERISVSKAILDHWLEQTANLTAKKRFKQLHTAFVTLKENEIADALKEKFEANDSINLEMFRTFDLERLGPYVPPPEEADESWEYEDEEEEDGEQNEEQNDNQDDGDDGK